MNCPHCDSPEVEHRVYNEKVDRSVYKCNSCSRRFRVDDDGIRADGGKVGDATYLDIAKSAYSIQFASWAVVCAAGFTASIVALQALNVGIVGAFFAGIIFGEIADRAVDPFTGWYLESRGDGA